MRTVEAVFESSSSSSIEYYNLYKSLGNPPIEWIEKAVAKIGASAPTAAYAAVKIILDESVANNPEYLSAFGITKKGESGIDQLKSVIPKIRTILVESLTRELTEKEQEILVSNKLGMAYAMQLIRFTEAEFGKKDAESWKDLVNAQAGLDIQPLPEGFVPSDEYRIGTRDREVVDAIKIRQDVGERFDVLRQDIKYVVDLIKSSRAGAAAPSNVIASQIKKLTEESVDQLRDKITASDNDRQKQGLQKRLNELEQALQSGTSAEDLMQNMHVLKGLQLAESTSGALQKSDTLLRQLAIAMVTEKDTSAVWHNAITASNEALTIDSVAFMKEFIDDNVLGRNNRKLGDSTEARKSLAKLLSTEAFTEQLVALKNIAFSNTSSLQFIPTRGLMLEFSGHFSDACWAFKYKSIAKKYPNITAMVMVRNKGTSTERIVGSSLLIDTVDQATGEPVLIIRGFNPIQNYLTDVNLDELVDNFVESVNAIAGNRKVAIVLDEQSGGALTNRPALHAKLLEKFGNRLQDGTRVTVDAKTTTFNSYVLKPEGKHPVVYL